MKTFGALFFYMLLQGKRGSTFLCRVVWSCYPYSNQDYTTGKSLKNKLWVNNCFDVFCVIIIFLFLENLLTNPIYFAKIYKHIFGALAQLVRAKDHNQA